MGCGTSNTLESSEFKKLENKQKTDFLKVVENEKSLQTQVTDFLLAVQECRTADDVKNMVGEVLANFPAVKMSKDEIATAFFYRMAFSKLTDETMPAFDNNGDLFIDLYRSIDENNASKARKILIENIGDKFAVSGCIFDNSQVNLEVLKACMNILRFDTSFHKDALVVLIPESLAADAELMKNIGSAAHLNAKLKNFCLALMPNDDPKAVVDLNNIGFLFEGLSLSKTLKNAGVIRISNSPVTINTINAKKIEDFIHNSLLLTCLGLGNIDFGKEDRTKLLEKMASKHTLQHLTLQFTGADDKFALELAQHLGKSKSLRFIAVGIAEDKRSDSLEKGEKIAKANAKCEAFIYDFFDK